MEFPENISTESEDGSDEGEESDKDEEVLAWINDPEMKSWIEEEKKKREEAILINSELMNKTDQTELDAQVKAQVELLGSKEMYFRISSNLKDHKFEPYFVKEQNKLFEWREQFFYKKFGHYNTTEGMKTWFTDGADDSHGFDTVPFQITKNFENVLMLGCSKDLGKSNSSRIYFENDEILSCDAVQRFSKILLQYSPRHIMNILLNICYPLNTSREETGLNFVDVAHMIVAEYSTTPPTLLEIAMKTVLLHKIPLHNETLQLPCKAVCCTSLKHKALHGLYRSLDYDIPANLSPKGKKLFEEHKEECNKVQFGRKLQA